MLFEEHIRRLLGRDRYISTSVYNGENLVHVRKFDGHIPLREGVALKLRQTKNLFDATERIVVAPDKKRKNLEGQKAEYLVLLGYGTFLKVCLFNELSHYDVRRYAVPSKTGLTMNKTEFKKLKRVREALFTALSQLNKVSAFDCMTKGNQLASVRCVECIRFHKLDY